MSIYLNKIYTVVAFGILCCYIIIVLNWKSFYNIKKNFNDKNKKNMRQPGIEPGPTAWKAAILTFRLLSQRNIF